MSLESVLCPTCGVDETEQFIPYGPKSFVRCSHCDLVYVNPRRPAEETRMFFQSSYINDEQKLRSQFGVKRAPTLGREATLLKVIVSSGRVLDVGCAGGEFLMHFEPEHWERHGVDPSSVAVRSASSRGIKVWHGVLENVDLGGSYFDLVTNLDTLYYTPSPYQDLRKIHYLLKEDGLLAIEVPGFTYWVLRNVGPISLAVNRRWCHLSPESPHLFYFSSESLRKLLGRAGFEVTGVIPEESPLSDSQARQLLKSFYLRISRLLFRSSIRMVDFAPKVLYLCRKSK